MRMRGGDISIQTRLHPQGYGVIFPILVQHLQRLTMILDTGIPVSIISPQARDDLRSSGLWPDPAGRQAGRLTGVQAQGQPLPDLDVRVSARLARLGVDGMLGLDFLLHFEHIHFHVPTLHLILQNPTNGAAGP